MKLWLITIGFAFLGGFLFAAVVWGQTAPTTYMADTTTTFKAQPAPFNPGPANTIFNDPVFGTQILRVTDANTAGGRSFVPTDAGNHSTFNSNNTRIKLTGPQGDGWWLEFNPSTFQVGTVPHSVPSQYSQTWEWSKVNPDIIYVLNGSSIASFNVSNGVTTNLGSTPDGSAVGYFANVVGNDNWVCAAAGPGQQDTWTRFWCLNVATPSQSKYVDITAKTVNGATQTDQNWPTGSGPNGIHGMMGGTGPNHLELTLRNPSWGGNGDAVFNLSTNTWQLIKAQTVTGGDIYWGGHFSLGQGVVANGAGNVSGNDSRGVLLRNANATMDNTQYRFIGQPTSPYNGWCDAEHTSWLNSITNPNAPIIQSRYISGCNYTWSDEIIGISTTAGSNTVYRFAHNYNGCPGSYYSQSFAQVSNDGMFVLFSSWWGGQLGGGSGFDCSSGRIDTFMLKLVSGDAPPPPPPMPVLSFQSQPTNTISGTAIAPFVVAVTGTLSGSVALQINNCPNISWSGSTTATITGGTATFNNAIPSGSGSGCTFTANALGATSATSNGFNVTVAAPETVTATVSPPCTLQGTTTFTVTNGVWSFPGMTVSAPSPPQTCTITVTDSQQGVTPIVSEQFTVLVNAPTQPVLVFTQQPTQTVNGMTITPTIAGTMTPGSVRPLRIGIDGSNCSLNGIQTVNSDSSGNWSFPGLIVTAVGLPATCWVSVVDTSTTNPAATVISNNFMVVDPTPPPPPTLTFVSQPGLTVTGQTMAPFIVGATSVNGTVTLMANACGASFTNLTALVVSGQATFNMIGTSGTGTACVFTASIMGATSIMSAPFDVTNVPPPITASRFTVPRGLPK